MPVELDTQPILLLFAAMMLVFIAVGVVSPRIGLVDVLSPLASIAASVWFTRRGLTYARNIIFLIMPIAHGSRIICK